MPRELFCMQKKVAACREERGKPEASISADIEMVLEKYKASRAAYQGGDYNGVSCQRIVGNSSDITREIAAVLQAKKDQTCSANVIKEIMHQLDVTLGLLDAAFYYLNIPHCEHTSILRALVKYPAEHPEGTWRSSGPQGLDVRHRALHSQPCNDSWGK
jgi:hypothetical protein